MNYLEDGSDSDEDFKEKDRVDLLMKKTSMNLYGYGDDYLEILKRERESGHEPNIRKIVKYQQV
jgi:hypothetical protein